MLAGCKSYVAIAEWAGRLTQKQLRYLRARYNPQTRRYEPPSETTIHRVLQSADVEALDAHLGTWFLQVAGLKPIAFDGKTLKGATRENGTQVQLLSAFVHGQGTVIAQREIAEKTNEIPELRTLLQNLDVQGQVITADALHTQRATASFLVEEKKAHYLGTAVKGIQRKLRDQLTGLPWGDSPPPQC